MKPKPKTRTGLSELRQGAEARVRAQWSGPPSGDGDSRSAADTQRLLHELQVHQTELEMQNEELRKARDDVEASHEKFRDLYEFAPIGYFTLTRNEGIEEVNLTGASLVGVERARLVGRSFTSLLSAALRPVFSSFLKRAFASPARPDGNFELVRSGKPPLIVSIKAQRAANGKDCRVMVVDITEQTRAEAATARLAAIVTSSNDAMISKDLNGIVTSWNGAAERLFGYSASEMVGRTMVRLIPTDCLREESYIMSQLSNGQTMEHYETMRVSKNGELLDVSVTVSPIRHTSGQIVGYSKIARDITDRKRIEAALRASEERLRLSQDVAQIGTFDWDIATGINQWTPKLEAMHGLTPGAFAKTLTAWKRLVHPDDRAAMVACLNRTLRSGKTVEGEWRVIWPDGSIHWMVGRLRAFKDSRGRAVRVAGVNLDITERKLSEKAQGRVVFLAALTRGLQDQISQRREVEKSLKKSERYQKQLVKQSRQLHAQLRRLARRVIQVQEEERRKISRELHDVIAQSLNGINIRLSVLRKEASLNVEGLDGRIADAQKLVANSVELVHEFARDLRPTVLDDLGLIPALNSFASLYSKQTRIKVRMKISEAVERLDITRRTVLYRVAQESFSNVARHAHASRVEVSILELPDRICMRIGDNGNSFDAERFLNARIRGRLGLLGMRERVEMVGGTFDITSEAGKGTTVIAQIPLGKAWGAVAAIVKTKP